MSVLTNNYYVNQVRDIVNSVSNTAGSLYIAAARSYPWTNDASPPPANDSVSQTELSIQDDLLFGKLITPSSISALIPNYPWQSGTVYDSYSQYDSDLYSKKFFVNSSGNVYKCIFNNYSAPSTVQPKLTFAGGTFKTTDGYVWKYMYTITSQQEKFVSTQHIPVGFNSFVAAAAVPGTIDYISLSNTGHGFKVYDSNNIVGIIDPYTISIPTSSTQDNYYAGSSIFLKSGLQEGQIRQIVSSNASARTIKVDPNTPINIYNELSIINVAGSIQPGYTAEQSFADRKSTRLNSSHVKRSRMPSSA